MATKKAETTENAQETTATPDVQKTPVVTEKVYKFVSQNKFLTCTNLGVQFINGKAEVKDLAVARELAKIAGVTLVED